MILLTRRLNWDAYSETHTFACDPIFARECNEYENFLKIQILRNFKQCELQKNINVTEYKKAQLISIGAIRNESGSKKDSAKCVEEFAYEMDQKGNIIKIEVKVLTKHHSRTIEKIYDSKNRIITKKRIFCTHTEYIYIRFKRKCN